MREQRIIKFRGRRKHGKEFLIGDLVRTCNGGPCIFPYDDSLGLNSPDYYEVDENTIGQYTGRKTIKGRDLYEGDIVFVEESEPEGDKRYYLVIVWIPEWAMFASLHMDEYHKFLKEGAEALDETMFWTYTIETAEKDFHYAGNLYENPELIDTTGQ